MFANVFLFEFMIFLLDSWKINFRHTTGKKNELTILLFSSQASLFMPIISRMIVRTRGIECMEEFILKAETLKR